MTATKYIIGSISSGTMREEDLIPSFMDALEELDAAAASKIRHDPENIDVFRWLEDSDNLERPEAAGWLLDELFDKLNALAPPYFHFGSNEGDGADYGFWLDSSIEDFDGLRVSDTNEVPDDYCGEVLHVNDHGNMTLYAKDEGLSELREIWSIV